MKEKLSFDVEQAVDVAAEMTRLNVAAKLAINALSVVRQNIYEEAEKHISLEDIVNIESKLNALWRATSPFEIKSFLKTI